MEERSSPNPGIIPAVVLVTEANQEKISQATVSRPRVEPSIFRIQTLRVNATTASYVKLNTIFLLERLIFISQFIILLLTLDKLHTHIVVEIGGGGGGGGREPG
jgi:hypothetical protein